MGIARNPRQVKRSINKKKFIKRTGVKPFVKCVNQNHVMPTRFVVNDFDLKELKEESLKSGESRAEIKKTLRSKFTETYRKQPDVKTNDKSQHIRFFFNRLRF